MTPKSISSALVAGLFASAALAQAPAPVSPGWSAYSGCWEPVPVEGQVIPARSQKVCLIPSGTNGADLLSLVSDSITERTHIEADGRRHDVARQGCSGWELASFSADGRRLYMDSEQQCGGTLKRKASGLFAVASNGQWVNIVNVTADGGEGLRVSRYSPVAVTAALPAEIFNALDDRALSDRTARVAAQARVTPDAIIEAGKFITAGVMEAWIAELDQSFNLDEKSLIRLADGGVEPSVIDVMVAVSNPKYFAVNATGGGVSTTPIESPKLESQRECLSPMFDPWGYYEYNSCDPFRRYGYYGSRRYGYGYNPYSYGLYDAYGYGSGYGIGYGRPVTIIVLGSKNDPNAGHGRMTKDGYKRDPTPTGTASTSTRTESSGSSGEKSSGSGSGSSGSSGRTATRKPPAN